MTNPASGSRALNIMKLTIACLLPATLTNADSAEFNQPYAIGGCREITPDGHIIGSFTELEGTEIKPNRGGKVWFFKIKAE